MTPDPVPYVIVHRTENGRPGFVPGTMLFDRRGGEIVLPGREPSRLAGRVADARKFRSEPDGHCFIESARLGTGICFVVRADADEVKEIEALHQPEERRE